MDMKIVILACLVAALLVGCAGAEPTREVAISFDWTYRAGDYVRAVPA